MVLPAQLSQAMRRMVLYVWLLVLIKSVAPVFYVILELM